MAQATILFADNDVNFIDGRKEFLERDGYHVIVATDPTQARRALEQEHIDLAILDIRLLRDYDEKDVSGLTLAKESARLIPKIMLTGYPTIQAAIEALAPDLEGLPPAIMFLTKQGQEQEGPEALLRAVREGLLFGKRTFRQTVDSLFRQLNEDYKDARRQARVHYWATLAVSLLGIGLVFAGVILVLQGPDDQLIGIASTVGGIVTEVVNYLFFSRVDVAYQRVDRYHHELLQMKWFESLLAAGDELLSSEYQEGIKKEIISLAAGQWFSQNKIEPD
jgi:CheY-like chemotaxis protein